MVEIFGQLVKLEIRRNAVHGPRFRYGLERTKQHLARVFLVIGTFVRHPQNGQLGQTRNGFGHDIEMLAGLKRNVHTCHAANGVPPHACAVDHVVTGHVPAGAILALPIHPRHATGVAGDGRDRHAFLHPRPTLARALGQRQRDIGRIALPVERQIHTTRNIIDIQMFIARLDLCGAGLFDLDAKCTGHRRLAVQLFEAFAGQCCRNRPHALEPRGHACFGFKVAVKLLTVLGQLGHVRRRTQLRDQTCRVPGRA